jgi:hypothetical protein
MLSHDGGEVVGMHVQGLGKAGHRDPSMIRERLLKISHIDDLAWPTWSSSMNYSHRIEVVEAY